MKSSQMSASLSAYARLLNDAGCSSCASDLETLATVFDRCGSQTVSAIVKKIAQRWKSSERIAEHPAPLKAQLEHIALALRAAGATPAAKDYGLVVSLFVGPGGANSRTFAEAAIRALEAERPPPQPPLPLDPKLISAFAEKLTASSTDNAKFDAVISELKAPRRFSNIVLAAIANRYLGAERTYKSKSEILKAIANRQLQDAIQGSRDRRIVKIAV